MWVGASGACSARRSRAAWPAWSERTSMPELAVLIAAAGRGTRAGLPYPKTLYPVQGVPILVRLLRLMAPFDRQPTVIVSPSGKEPIAACLVTHGLTAHLVEQPAPSGMGDA